MMRFASLPRIIFFFPERPFAAWFSGSPGHDNVQNLCICENPIIWDRHHVSMAF